jgi:hypothetical protein
MFWASLWTTFSQKHLAALVAGNPILRSVLYLLKHIFAWQVLMHQDRLFSAQTGLDFFALLKTNTRSKVRSRPAFTTQRFLYFSPPWLSILF